LTVLRSINKINIIPRPKLIENKQIMRLIKESEYYNRRNKKWVSNREARITIAKKLMVSEETVFRAIRILVKEKYLIPTEYRGIYVVK